MHSSLRILSNRGSALLVTMGFAAVIGILGITSMTFMLDLNKHVVVNNNLAVYRLATHSLLDYTLNGVRARWCFSTTWLPDVGNCDLFNPRSVERMVLSDRALRSIFQSKPVSAYPQPLGAVRLAKIDVTIPISDITQDHPLYVIVAPLISQGFNSMRFQLERIDNVSETSQDQAVPLKVRVSVTSPSMMNILKRNELFAEAKVIVFPRELSTFSLILPNDLYLDGQDDGLAYNSSISGGGAGTGLRFESPVFVNGNIFVPRAGAATMNKVTFLDKVILGGGYLYQGEELYRPASGGGPNDQYYAQSPGFGGFMGGLEMDAVRDKGLDHLAGVLPSPPVDLTFFRMCQARSKARVDLNLTNDSQLYVQVINGTTGSALSSSTEVGFSLGAVDAFRNQTGTAFRNASGTAPMPTLRNNGPLVLRLTVNVYGYDGGVQSYAVDMSRSGRASFSMGPSGFIKVTTKPHEINGNPQSQQVDLVTEFINQSSWLVAPYTYLGVVVPPSITMNVEAYDYAYSRGANARSGPPAVPLTSKYKVSGIEFKYAADGTFRLNTPRDAGINGGFFTCSQFDSAFCPAPIDRNVQAPLSPPDNDLFALDQRCFGTPPDDDQMAQAFGAADWNISFADQAKHSWGFKPFGNLDDYPDGYYPGTVNFDINNAGFNAAAAEPYPAFQVYGRIKECRVKPDATFLSGFLVCDKFVIEGRATPLRIIGTVIANRVEINSSAINAGIRWSSIHQTSAVYELRQAGILNPGNTLNCDLPNEPMWSPTLSIGRLQEIYRCLPFYLRNKADPFRWSTVDPDCGLLPASGQMQCKNRVINYVIKEVSRTGTL